MNKKKFIFSCFVFFIVINTLSFSEDFLVSANRKTAIRCLKLAENFLSSNSWGNALSQADLGLAYDSSISDLLYIKAVAKLGLEEPRAEVISLVMKALTEGEWVDYNRDSARILYADLLCDSGNFDQALNIINAKPFIYSSDAEYIRIKSYYRMGTKESIKKAREKINSARKIYSADTRFPKLFFKYEFYSALKNNVDINNLCENQNSLVKMISDSFVAKIPEYDNPDAELEMFAILFAKGEQKRRLLQAFTAHGMEHPLYAGAALSCGIISQQEAWDYFCKFANNSIDIRLFDTIIPFITDEITIESVKQYLNSFSGKITVDTDYDCEPNLFIDYSRGRSQLLKWDMNNDDVYEFFSEFDFGVPTKLDVTQGNIQLEYGTYPFVINATYKNISETPSAFFVLADESFAWTPLDVKTLDIVKKYIGYDFFVPFVNTSYAELNENLLLKYCSSYRVPTKERDNGMINFSVVDGFPQVAEYSVNGIVYAQAFFENGYPITRAVDNNDDGIFETTETFGFDADNLMNISKDEQEQLMTNLFGLPMSGSGLYVKMIQIDENADTVPDFSEEFIEYDGKISSWDYDGDGNWDVRYKRYPLRDKNDPLIEDSEFYKMPEKQLVVITRWNGVPVKVAVENMIFSVTEGTNSKFYWVGECGSADDELYILENIVSDLKQGISVVVQNNEKRISVVSVENCIFAEILPPVDEQIFDEKTVDEQTE